MTSALRALALGVVLLLTNQLFAQTDSVDLAVIAEINVTLDENCSFTLIPQEVLKGDFDADGDGNEPFDAFTLVVEDADPSNDNIIDNCGYFRVVITAEGIRGFTTGWGWVRAEDKTSPEFTATPSAPAGPLYCDDVARIDIGLLPNTVSRCYQFNTFTETIVANTLDERLEERLLAGGGLPSATDNCSEIVEICVNDIVTRAAENPNCNDVVLTRTFTVTDGSCGSEAGESNDPAVTSYDITFTQPTLGDLDVTNIPEVVVIECDELDGLGLSFGESPAPRTEDLPFFPGPDGTRLSLTPGDGSRFCNIGLTYEDSPEITTCDLAYKVIRTYSVIDWCNPTDVLTFTQVVKVGDFTAPEFTAPTQDLDFDGEADGGPLRFPTNAGNLCGAYIRLDMAGIVLTDACSSDLSLRADIFPNGDTDARPIGTFNLDLTNLGAEVSSVIPVGDHVLRYTYRDECGNEDFTDVDISIVDGVEPLAVCEDGLNVSLSIGASQDGTVSQGIAVITPEMVDKGSYDDCSDVELAIGRVRQNADGTYQLINGATYGPTIEFTCEDLGEQLVGLRVTDASGNVNYCWLTVLVEDKLNPVCTPPSTLNLTCIAYRAASLPANIQEASDELLDAAFGQVSVSDNCEVSVVQSITGSVNSCGVGSFERTFEATDGEGFTNARPCRQIINVEGVHDYILSFPGDSEAFCRETPTYGDVEAEMVTCDLISKDFEIDTLETDADECYKLRIEHRIINWCEYNSLGQPYLIPRDYDLDNDMRERTYLHVYPSPFTGRDTAFLDNDIIRTNQGFTRELDDGNDNDNTDDNNGADNNDTDDYATDNSRGAFTYYQFVKIYDEVAPEIVANEPTECFGALSANCTGEVTLVFQLTDECTAFDQLGSRIGLDVDYVAENGFGRTRFLTDAEISNNGEGDFTVSLENVPVGNHAIRVQGTDGCGNVDVEIISFCVTDDKAPTPICIGQLTATLMPNGDGTGMAAMWATDFIASDVEDCSGEVTYSIYTEQEAQAAGFTPEAGRDGIILDCNSAATIPTRVYAFDPLGRADYCSVFILVQRAENACVVGGSASLRGTVATEAGVPIAHVAVGLSEAELTASAESDADGNFEFNNLDLGQDYTIDADRRDYVDHSQGVSTFDLVLITRFILGLEAFNSPFERLAADANNDKTISVQDIIAIRRLILGLDQAYRNNSAFRFVAANFNFPVANDPWATTFPEVVNINNLPGNVFDADFIGVMVGNVDGNGLDRVAGDDGRPRSGGRKFSVEDRALRSGNSYELAIRADGLTDLAGLQGTFRFSDAVEVTEVLTESTLFTAAHLNQNRLERGQLGFSFAAATGLRDELPVLRLRLVAREDAQLSEVLSITDELVYAAGYTATGASVRLGFTFSPATDAAATGNVLGQNVPNPVSSATLIPFQLAEAGTVQLEIRDISGRLLLQRSQEAAAGNGQFHVQRSALGASGLVTYSLSAGDFTATRKMMVR